MEHHQTKAGARNKGEKDIVACPDLLIRQGLPICDCIVANTKEISPGVRPADVAAAGRILYIFARRRRYPRLGT
jgi:hypothetical protein